MMEVLYNPKSPFSPAKHVARIRYLEVLNRHYPKLLEKIQNLVLPRRKVSMGRFPYFDDDPVIAEAERRLSVGETPLEWRELSIDVPDLSPIDELFVSLELPDDGRHNYWFTETVYYLWHSSEESEDGRISVKLNQDVTRSLTVPYSLPPEVQTAIEGCNPTREDEIAFTKRITALLQKDLKQHFGKAKAAYLEEGFLKVPDKRNKQGDPLLHFEWVYLTHVGEQGKTLTQKEVARRFCVEPENVSRAINPLKVMIFTPDEHAPLSPGLDLMLKNTSP